MKIRYIFDNLSYSSLHIDEKYRSNPIKLWFGDLGLLTTKYLDGEPENTCTFLNHVLSEISSDISVAV